MSRRMLLRSLAGVGTGAALGTAAAALLATPAAALAGEWQIYTPSLTAATTNPNLGGGSANGHYLWDGRLVVVKANITFGNTETAGAGLGQYRVSLPVTPKLGSDAWLGPTGMAILNKKYSGLLRHASVILTDDSPQIVSFKLDNDTGPVDNDTPWVWANVPNPSTQSKADSISMFMIYEASADPS